MAIYISVLHTINLTAPSTESHRILEVIILEVSIRCCKTTDISRCQTLILCRVTCICLWITGLRLNYYNLFFYIRNSLQRNSRLKKSNKMQQYADIYLLLNYSTCFGRPSRPSSGVHTTVVTASGTDHTIWGASSFFKASSRSFEEARNM